MVGIHVTELDREVVFEGKWKRVYGNEIILNAVEWNESKYSKEENEIIEKYVDQAGNKIIDEEN